MSLWCSISQVGIDANGSWLKNRDIIICNRVSVILSGLTFFMASVFLAYFGWNLSVGLSFGATGVFLLPIAFNDKGFVNIGRMFLVTSLSIVLIGLSIVDKVGGLAKPEEFQFFEFRLMLLGAGLLPFILFQLHERRYWISAYVINALCVVLYDPVHMLFHAGYYQLGFVGEHYSFLNILVIIASLLLGAGTFFLKYSFQIHERKNELLIHNLHKANALIQQQQALLTKENIQLSRDLVDKNNLLTETNQELIQHNNDLLQFSYTVSHNLRGPVASMLGLLNLINHDSLGENREIIEYIRNSVASLDSTIKDLNGIIDIRNKITKVKQLVSLEEEVNHVIALLRKEINDHKIQVRYDFSTIKTLYSVRPMLSSVLYNLISNAIKYRSPERLCIIQVRAEVIGDQVRIDVSDNGLGLDVEKYKEKLFGLYKRFHTHMEGKGIGLFLVKLQTEALGGKVHVQSTPGQGTTFSVLLKMSVPLAEPLLMDLRSME